MKTVFLTLCMAASCSSAFAYISQGNWRWRNDNGSEISAGWKAPQNTAIQLTNASNLRLRIQVNNNLDDDKQYTFPLQYATSPDGPWRYISRATGSNAFVLTRQSGFVTDYTATTKQLNGGSNPFQTGRLLVDTDLPDTLLPAHTTSEYEWCIKPTVYIQPNSTYYFRTPVGDYPKVLPSLTVGSSPLIRQPLVSNGSFEQSLTGWSSVITNGGDATFSVIDSVHHYGSRSLQASIKKLGTNNLSTGIAHASFAVNPVHTYMVRFWGRSSKDAGRVRLVLEGNTSREVSFRLFPDMEEYQYAFKTNETNIALKFFFNSKADYVLDDIELLDETDPSIDVNMNYMWQNNRPGYGWVTGDGQESIQLPDGRVAWLFSDSWLGYNDTTVNNVSTSLLVNNMAVLQDGTAPSGTLISKFGGTLAAPKALVEPPEKAGYRNWLWPRGMTVENNQLKVMLPDCWYKTNGADAAYRNKQVLAVFSLPGLELVSAKYQPYIDTVEFNILLEDNGAYNYVYGAKEVSTFNYQTMVARYPKGMLDVNVPWEFYNTNGWVSDYHQASPISDASFGSVIKLGNNNYAAVFLAPLSDKMEAYYATSPLGPWTNRTILYQIPGEDHLTYFGVAHKETAVNGIYTISYSNNYTIGRMLDDKGMYIPNYQKVNLLALSPYTSGSAKQTLFAFTAEKQETNAKLQWKTTASTDYTSFMVQHSIDGKQWVNIATVKAIASATKDAAYTITDSNLCTGKNYYHVQAIDNKGIITTSATRVVELNSTIALQVSPNPVSSNIHFTLSNYNGTAFTISLVDMKGNTLESKNMQVQKGRQDYQYNFTKQPAAGTYILKIAGSGGAQSTTIIIQ